MMNSEARKRKLEAKLERKMLEAMYQQDSKVSGVDNDFDELEQLFNSTAMPPCQHDSHDDERYTKFHNHEQGVMMIRGTHACGLDTGPFAACTTFIGYGRLNTFKMQCTKCGERGLSFSDFFELLSPRWNGES